MDGWMDGWMDAMLALQRSNRQMNVWANERTNKRASELTNQCTKNKRMKERTNKPFHFVSFRIISFRYHNCEPVVRNDKSPPRTPKMNLHRNGFEDSEIPVRSVWRRCARSSRLTCTFCIRARQKSFEGPGGAPSAFFRSNWPFCV